MSKKFHLLLFSLLLTALSAPASFAGAGRSDDRIWQEIDDSALAARPAERLVRPREYRTFRLDKTALDPILKKAPLEFTGASRNAPVILTMPMPDGSFQRFQIEESPVMEPGLAAKFPEIKTYRAYGIDDPTAFARFDLMPTGFHSMILSTKGTIFIDPYAKGDTQNYISYLKRNVDPTEEFRCDFDEQKDFDGLSAPEKFNIKEILPELAAPSVTSGTEMRTYRLALAATNEYASTVGGNTIAGTLAAQVLVMNRVNGVYNRDLAIQMNMVNNNDQIIYAGDNTCNGVACTSGNDPYSNGSGSTMLGQNTTNLNTVIGSANYDIGHVFSTGGGGVATLNGPCGGSKARGVTGLSNPVGDPFAIDYVAHEMGHQWGAGHTFNGTVSSCGGGNRSSGSAYEPGSGITIMAYAGICGNQNLSNHSIDTFHVKSLEAIVNYSQSGNGNTCAATTPTGNTPPSVSLPGGNSFNIPKETPFSLTASATDVNGDPITYDWQEYDLGASTTAVPNTDSDGSARPIFRPYLPVDDGTRYFPSMPFILDNANVPPSTTGSFLTGELLPSITRTMNFQVVARDNRMGGGGINSTTATVVVDGGSGPFSITAPNTGVSWQGGSQQTVSWNVNNTNNAPVSAANVKISLSTDGGQSFPTVLLASTPNDGSQSITIPNTPTSQARIKVEAVGNIFFDISDANFTITPGVGVNRRPVFDYDGDDKTDISIFRPGPGEWWYLRSGNGGNNAFQFGSSTDRMVPADFTGDDKTDIAFWRESTGEWFVLRSEDSSFYSFPFGTTNDIPVPADYDGDGKADPAIFRPSSATWFIIRSTDGGTTIAQFGANTDLPVPADYDGDGKADLAIFRPGDGSWWLNRSTAGLIVYNFGTGTDRTVPGDYTGDGKADVAFWRPTTGEWFILRSEDASFYSGPFGAMGDVPVPGDYDGDGKYDTAVFRPSNSTWFKQGSTSGFEAVTFGIAGDLPTPNAFVR
ncbi:MAG: M12 family metallo-peptidase [Pyrinomonadaceae bacterium]